MGSFQARRSQTCLDKFLQTSSLSLTRKFPHVILYSLKLQLRRGQRGQSLESHSYSELIYARTSLKRPGSESKCIGLIIIIGPEHLLLEVLTSRGMLVSLERTNDLT